MTDKSDIAFLFDLDGVIIDSEKSYSRFWRDIDRMYPSGIPHFERVIKGTTLYDILDRYYPDPRIRADVEKRCWALESEIVYGYEIGAEELLKELKRRDIPAVLVTSSDKVKMENLWRQLPGLRELLAGVIDAEMVSRSKPDPEGYLKGAAIAGVSPKRCVVFEDSLTGVQAGRAAGAYVVGMSGTLGAEKVAPYSDIVLDTLTQLDLDALIETLRTR